MKKTAGEIDTMMHAEIATLHPNDSSPQIVGDPSTVAFILTPTVDYGDVSSQIAKIEEMAKEHPMSARGNIAAPLPLPDRVYVQDQVITTQSFVPVSSQLHLPVAESMTGRKAVGPRIAPIPTDKQKEKINFLSEPIKREEEDPNLPPIHDDFLSFLIEKQPLSFGWVVDPIFLANFDIRPDLFEPNDKFIFWIVPAHVNIFKISSAGGFQKSESRTQQIHPHIFFIKILEIPEGHEEEDPFTGIINDVRYINLRETLDKRGIQFVYDHNANRIWSSIICGRLKIK